MRSFVFFMRRKSCTQSTTTRRLFVESERSSKKPKCKVPRIPNRGSYTRKDCDERRDWVEKYTRTSLKALAGWWEPKFADLTPDILQGRVEAPIGLAKIPVGIAGPMIFNGANASGAYLAPMALVEGAVVASASRGVAAINSSGGVTTCAIKQSIGRAPVFITEDSKQTRVLFEWFSDTKLVDNIQNQVVSKMSGHTVLKQLIPIVDHEAVHVLFVYQTGDAAGQNMSTKCTWKAVHWLKDLLEEEIPRSQLVIRKMFVEGILAGDKNCSFFNMVHGRGTGTSAAVDIPYDVVKSVLKVEPQDLLELWNRGVRMSQRVGSHGPVSNSCNMITALFIATGQDIACAHESSIGQLSLLAVDEQIRAELFLPSLVVGTVGGATNLPTQAECLKIMDCYGPGKRDKLAEIIAGYCLALEVSTLAALAAGEFADSMLKLARSKARKDLESDL